jgi:hypothetical protein
MSHDGERDDGLGSGAERMGLDTDVIREHSALTDLVAVDEALTRLEAIDARKAQVVTLRYFAGLSIKETLTRSICRRLRSRTSGRSRALIVENRPVDRGCALP